MLALSLSRTLSSPVASPFMFHRQCVGAAFQFLLQGIDRQLRVHGQVPVGLVAS
jgi:hypothetical protein